MKLSSIFVTVAALALTASPSLAAVFTSGHGVNPTACNSSTSTGPFATGQILTYNSTGCQGGYSVSLNTVARTITFTTAAAPFADYRFSEFSATGITEATITGLRAIQLAPLFNISRNPAPTSALSFTGNSINILFGTRSSSTPIFDFTTNGGQAIFEYDTLAAAVPEPATWLMMIAGFGLVGAGMRRRNVSVSYA
jgi:PEP-CTERM motif